MWKHDLYNGPKTLGDRISNNSSGAATRRVDLSGVEQALRAAGVSVAGGNLSIKGASQTANVVEVTNLVGGTTAADVEVYLFFFFLNIFCSLHFFI